jgi:hypothetical protein
MPADVEIDQWTHPEEKRWLRFWVGTYLADQAMRASGKTAADLVSTSSDEVIRMGLAK